MAHPDGNEGARPNRRTTPKGLAAGATLLPVLGMEAQHLHSSGPTKAATAYETQRMVAAELRRGNL